MDSTCRWLTDDVNILNYSYLRIDGRVSKLEVCPLNHKFSDNSGKPAKILYFGNVIPQTLWHIPSHIFDLDGLPVILRPAYRFANSCKFIEEGIKN